VIQIENNSTDTQLFNTYITIQRIHNYSTHTQLFNAYTTIQRIHNYSTHTQLFNTYITIQNIHNYSTHTQLFNAFITSFVLEACMCNVHSNERYFLLPLRDSVARFSTLGFFYQTIPPRTLVHGLKPLRIWLRDTVPLMIGTKHVALTSPRTHTFPTIITTREKFNWPYFAFK
jgi:hypothetical protein